MTTYHEEPLAIYSHLPCHPPYLDDRRSCRPYHPLRSLPHAPPPPPPAPAPPPPPPLFHPPPQYHPTPPTHYPLQHRQEPPPHISRPYQTFIPHTPSPRHLEPSPYFVGTWSKDKFITLSAYVLDAAAEYNNDFVALPNYTQPESVYFSVSRPEIPTKDYIRRLVTYTRCSPAAFVVMLIYIDRIARANPLLLVTPFNMHRLLVTALTLACKFLDDRCYSNIHYAKVGGIPTAREMNRLELQYLKYVDYRLHVDLDDYRKKLSWLKDSSPPSSPTTIMVNTSPVTTACASPTSPVTAMDRSPMAVERTLDFEGRFGLGPMLDKNPAVDVIVEPGYPSVPKADPYTQQHHHHQHARQRVNQEKWFHWKSSPRQPAQRTVPKRSSRRDGRVASSLDTRFYHGAHPSSMPIRYAECAP